MKRKGRPVHGWVIVDKPLGLTSTQCLARVRRLTDAAKGGHGGTLDPLATGILPIALGEATKTVAWVMGSGKTYRFTVRWGIATATDDAEGGPVATSDRRPGRAAIEAILPGFTGQIMQRPPAYSAIKIDGARAYDLARAQSRRVARSRIWPRGRSGSTGWPWSIVRIRTMPSSRSIAARAPMSVHWLGISARRWAVSAMSWPCAAPGSAGSTKAGRFHWIHWRNCAKRAPRTRICCRLKPRWTTSRPWL